MHRDPTSWVSKILPSRGNESAVAHVDASGNITSWTESAERLFGWRADEVIGRSIHAIVPDDQIPEDDELRKRALDGETITVNTFRRRRNDSTFPVTLTVTGLRQPNSRSTVTDVMILAIEQTESQERHEASLRLAAIVESSDDAIISKDLNGIVMTWNDAAERIFGYTAAEMIGRSIRTIIPDDRQGEEDATLATIRRGDKVDHFQTIRRRKNGELLPISLTVSPIRDDDGRIIGASKIARDITIIKQAEAERFRLLEDTANITETLNQVGAAVASDLDRTVVVQAVTDAATELTTAEFGAFFYNLVNEAGESYTLYTISGVPKEVFANFPMPRNTDLFDTTFKGIGVVRSADITKDPRYGRNPPYHGMPPGHLPVRSYLAVPVKSRTSEVVGGLFFGHHAVGRFSAQHERLAVGIASWASVALENARLYRSVQEANQLKDDFLASLSHELRTPLNAIGGYARMLRVGLLDPEKHAKAIETIERNAKALTKIVEDVLDVSRIISGKMRLNIQPVDFSEIVRTAVDAVAPAADAKDVTVETALDPAASPIWGDPDRLQQVLWNLTSNAVKFSNRGGNVQIRLDRFNAHVEIVVTDTGIGISPEFMPHIFERFRQADTALTRERGGLGLGLAIARELVEMHGGTIHASSAGPGQGASFLVTLPVTPPAQ